MIKKYFKTLALILSNVFSTTKPLNLKKHIISITFYCCKIGLLTSKVINSRNFSFLLDNIKINYY